MKQLMTGNPPELDERVALVCIHEAADHRRARLDAAARGQHGSVDEGGEVHLADARLSMPSGAQCAHALSLHAIPPQ
eukprot:1159367-Pelagomonas_calceolata.AAC.2